MKYLTKIKRKGPGKYSWVFNPPLDAVKAGIASRQTFHDGRTAKAVVQKYIDSIDSFRKGDLVSENLHKDCTFLQLTASYLSCSHFQKLSGSTKESYEYTLSSINETIGNKKVKDFSAIESRSLYDKWVLDRGIPWANKSKRIFGVLLSYAESLDIVLRNPMSKIKPLTHTPRSVTWTKEQVEIALECCFSNFRYRNLGIILLLCYEWGQRPVDIQHLKWENIDFDENSVFIKQKKRGAEVTLPLDPELKLTLLRQKEDYDFQEYVAPRFRTRDSAYRPYTSSTLTPLLREVIKKTGLPDNLQIRDLRKTAIVEMVAAGIDGVGILPVSGHKNISSLNPYLKNTKEAASRALLKRKLN